MSNSSGKHNVGVIPFPHRWLVYCFITGRGANIIREWLDSERVTAAQRGNFQAKLDSLERGGPDLNPGLISETPIAKDIYKMKIKGNKGQVQLRPMVCKGPFVLDSEYTLLCGAIERDNKLNPHDATTRAQDNRATLIADHHRRRRERID